MFAGSNISYAPDDTPRTIHMCIDPVIVVDEAAGTAKAKHYTVVVQGIPDVMKPQVIVMDVKYDTFKRGADGKRKFASRVMGSRCAGDVSHHQKAFDPSYFGAENTLYPKDVYKRQGYLGYAHDGHQGDEQRQGHSGLA